MASARQRPENQKENQAGHSPELGWFYFRGFALPNRLNYERGFRRPALPQAQLTAITTHHTTMPMRHATKHTPPPAAGTRTAPWPLRDRAIIQPPPGSDPPFVSQAGGSADFRASRLKRCTSPAGLSTRPLTRRGACARQRPEAAPGSHQAAARAVHCHVGDHATMRATRRCSTVARPMRAMSATTRYLARRRAQLTRRVARIVVTNPSVVTPVCVTCAYVRGRASFGGPRRPSCRFAGSRRRPCRRRPPARPRRAW